MRLQGATALVTGASRGIGAALAAELQGRGARVTGVSRTGADVCDVSDPAQVAALFARTGPVDLLVNNAAVIHRPAPLWDVPLEEWESVLRINVLGTVAMLQAYLPAMNERGSGFVVNLSSGWGRFAAPEQSPYCASKFAVEALTSSVADEVADGVCVIALNPGVIATDMLERAFRGDVAGYPAPAETARAFATLLESLDPSWNGRSVNL
ncbi:MAG: SDR family NAD(P)-dependent oxidoreductase [Planctomycetota bacterium]|jgi:NAD(P)-dependent dehydrogenase (short-subunit alcohol dehydrogenase family)